MKMPCYQHDGYRRDCADCRDMNTSHPTVPATEGATERRSGKEGSRLIAHAPDNRCKISGAHAERDCGRERPVTPAAPIDHNGNCMHSEPCPFHPRVIVPSPPVDAEEIARKHAEATRAEMDGLRGYDILLDDTIERTIATAITEAAKPLVERMGELEGTLPGRMKGCQAVADEKCRCFLERAEAAEAKADSLAAALERMLRHDAGCVINGNREEWHQDFKPNPACCAYCEAAVALASLPATTDSTKENQ